jgi:hypothetical protein
MAYAYLARDRTEKQLSHPWQGGGTTAWLVVHNQYCRSYTTTVFYYIIHNTQVAVSSHTHK